MNTACDQKVIKKCDPKNNIFLFSQMKVSTYTEKEYIFITSKINLL